MAKKEVTVKPLTKTELLNNVAEATGLSKKQVAAVLEALTAEIAKSLGKGGAGQITLPGLVKIYKRHKPATKKRQVRSPATGEMVWAKPKPAGDVVKVRPLKALKDMV